MIVYDIYIYIHIIYMRVHHSVFVIGRHRPRSVDFELTTTNSAKAPIGLYLRKAVHCGSDLISLYSQVH